MTAEVAVLSRSAVAMAADSAATYGSGTDSKVFSSANKIFSLSKHHPVGIMIYGNAEFTGVPWETIIKHYRDRFGSESFESLPEFASRFLSFVKNEPGLASRDDELDHAEKTIRSYLRLLERNIRGRVTKSLEDKDDLTEKEVVGIVNAVLERHDRMWESAREVPALTTSLRTKVVRAAEGIIKRLIPKIFENLLSAAQRKRVEKMAANILLLWPQALENGTSGIVIAGFGTKDLFPKLRSFSVRGRFWGCLQVAEWTEQAVDISREMGQAIIPFAQTDVVRTFLEGVAPEYQTGLERDFAKILEKVPLLMLDHLAGLDEQTKLSALKEVRVALSTALAQYRDGLENLRYERYISPVLAVLNGLPKDELATMAESLVSLTSLRRRMSLEPDSVGGPIDVAVISRGDGFIWMRRKHYFRPELNHHFFANYYKEIRDED